MSLIEKLENRKKKEELKKRGLLISMNDQYYEKANIIASYLDKKNIESSDTQISALELTNRINDIFSLINNHFEDNHEISSIVRRMDEIFSAYYEKEIKLIPYFSVGLYNDIHISLFNLFNPLFSLNIRKNIDGKYAIVEDSSFSSAEEVDCDLVKNEIEELFKAFGNLLPTILELEKYKKNCTSFFRSYSATDQLSYEEFFTIQNEDFTISIKVWERRVKYFITFNNSEKYNTDKLNKLLSGNESLILSKIMVDLTEIDEKLRSLIIKNIGAKQVINKPYVLKRNK